MHKYGNQDEFTQQIMEENGLSKEKSYAVCYQDATCIVLLCHETRDTVTIHKGDRKWQKKSDTPTGQS